MKLTKRVFAEISTRRVERMKKIAACMCESDEADDSGEGYRGDYMSHQNVAAILEQAIFIAKAVGKHLEDDHQMEDWLEDKISKVADDMDEIYKYLKFGKR